MAAEHDGASVAEILVEACRRNNTDLLGELLEGKSDDEIGRLLNETTTVMGNHLYHEAAARGHYEIIDLLLDQPGFECDPVNRAEGDTPLHTVIRWINSEPPAQREFGNSLVEMMLEAGSSTRVRNKGKLTPLQLVDPRNEKLKELIKEHDYASTNAGDFVSAGDDGGAKKKDKKAGKEEPRVAESPAQQGGGGGGDNDDDDAAEFSGSDEEERAEWERRRKGNMGM